MYTLDPKFSFLRENDEQPDEDAAQQLEADETMMHVEVVDDAAYRTEPLSLDGASADSEAEEADKKKSLLNYVRAEIERVRTYRPKVGVFGVTGVGKSSLCNALFGRDVAAISDVAACTRVPQEVVIGDAQQGGITLVDVPGVGENEARDIEYIEMYKRLMPELDLVLWAIKADDRAYSAAVRAYREAVMPFETQCPVVFVITHADKIEPFREWDELNNRPSVRQMDNLAIKKHEVAREFGVQADSVVAVSSHEQYNLDALVTQVVNVLPNEKKVSFAREAKAENVTQEAFDTAENGLLDYIAEKCGDALYYVRYELNEMLQATIREYAPKVVEGAARVVKSWFRKMFS